MTLMVLAVFPVRNAIVPMKAKLMLLVPPSHLNADHGNIAPFSYFFLGVLPLCFGDREKLLLKKNELLIS